MRQAVYYDREAGIVFIDITPRSRWRRERFGAAEQRSWGLILRAGQSHEVVAVEMWRPKEMLPPDLLDAIPSPTWTRWEALARAVGSRLDWVMWKLWRQRKFERWRNSPQGLAAQAQQPPLQRWYRGLPAPPDDPDAAADYWRQHPDVK